MKILIAYDGSGYSRNALRDLRRAGLPDKADVLMISVSEGWLETPREQLSYDAHPDKEILEYFRKHSGQMDRNLAETRNILIQAKDELQNHFPGWVITIEVTEGSPGQTILQRSAAFEPDMIVMGSKGLSSAAAAGLGSVSHNILSYSRFPVRIGRESFDAGKDRPKIAICFDGSACSMETVKTAALRDWPEKSEFRLFVVTDPLAALIPGRAFQVAPGVTEDRMKGEEKWINDLADDALRILKNSRLTVSLHIYSGNPRIILARESTEWRANTVFVGMNSRRTDSLGSVAAAVAARSSCSVEIIPGITN